MLGLYGFGNDVAGYGSRLDTDDSGQLPEFLYIRSNLYITYDSHCLACKVEDGLMEIFLCFNDLNPIKLRLSKFIRNVDLFLIH